MMNLRNAAKLVYDFLVEETTFGELSVADAIFVFGHHDQRVAEHATWLYHEHLAEFVIVTGGVGSRTHLPTGWTTEAGYYRDVLLSEGVPVETIVVEDCSTNTLENVTFGLPLAEKVFGKIDSLIAVAMPPLLRRSLATLRQHYQRIEVCGSAFQPEEGEWFQPPRVQRLLGELERLELYAKQGDIAPVAIPIEVKKARQALTNYTLV